MCVFSAGISSTAAVLLSSIGVPPFSGRSAIVSEFLERSVQKLSSTRDVAACISAVVGFCAFVIGWQVARCARAYRQRPVWVGSAAPRGQSNSAEEGDTRGNPYALRYQYCGRALAGAACAAVALVECRCRGSLPLWLRCGAASR